MYVRPFDPGQPGRTCPGNVPISAKLSLDLAAAPPLEIAQLSVDGPGGDPKQLRRQCLVARRMPKRLSNQSMFHFIERGANWKGQRFDNGGLGL